MPDVEDVQEMDFLQLGDDPSQYENNTDDSKDIDKDEDINNKEEDLQEPDIEEDDKEIEDQSDTDNTEQSGKDEVESDPEPDEEVSEDEESIFKHLIDNSGVEFEEDEKQQLLELEENDQNFNRVAETIADRKAQSRFQSLMEQYPDAAKLVQYQMNGGDSEKFFETYYPENDYSEMEVPEDDVQTQKQLVTESLKLQGLDQEDINAELQDLEDAGLLSRRAERSLKALRKHQEQKQEEFEQEQQKLQKQREQEAKEQYEKTTNIIDSGEINGVQIPETKQNEFKEYIFEPVDDQGNTQAQIDSQQLDTEQRLLIAYLTYSGYNLDDFINTQAENKSAKNLRKSIKKSSSKESLKKKGKEKQNTGKPEDIVSPFI